MSSLLEVPVNQEHCSCSNRNIIDRIGYRITLQDIQNWIITV